MSDKKGVFIVPDGNGVTPIAKPRTEEMKGPFGFFFKDTARTIGTITIALIGLLWMKSTGNYPSSMVNSVLSQFDGNETAAHSSSAQSKGWDVDGKWHRFTLTNDTWSDIIIGTGGDYFTCQVDPTLESTETAGYEGRDADNPSNSWVCVPGKPHDTRGIVRFQFRNLSGVQTTKLRYMKWNNGMSTD